MSSQPYTGSLLFCKNSLFSTIKLCARPVGASPQASYSATPLVENIILPKKVRVFNKHEHILTQKQQLRWASRNKYR